MFKATVAYIDYTGDAEAPEVITRHEAKNIIGFSLWLVDAVKYFEGSVLFGGGRDVSILTEVHGVTDVIYITK